MAGYLPFTVDLYRVINPARGRQGRAPACNWLHSGNSWQARPRRGVGHCGAAQWLSSVRDPISRGIARAPSLGIQAKMQGSSCIRVCRSGGGCSIAPTTLSTFLVCGILSGSSENWPHHCASRSPVPRERCIQGHRSNYDQYGKSS